VIWFELDHISRSAARFDPQKLLWLNAHYIKHADDTRLATLVLPYLRKNGCDPDRGPPADRVVALLKERVGTIEELADAAVYFYRPLEPTAELRAQHYSAEALTGLSALADRLETVEWTRPAIGAAVKAVADEHKLKMPKIAMPLRVMVTGETQTPSIDATLELIGRDEVLARMRREISSSRPASE
jgi:glutamyl-tRNA synthetase